MCTHNMFFLWRKMKKNINIFVKNNGLIGSDGGIVLLSQRYVNKCLGLALVFFLFVFFFSRCVSNGYTNFKQLSLISGLLMTNIGQINANITNSASRPLACIDILSGSLKKSTLRYMQVSKTHPRYLVRAFVLHHKHSTNYLYWRTQNANQKVRNVGWSITKTRLFEYIEYITIQKGKFSGKKF